MQCGRLYIYVSGYEIKVSDNPALTENIAKFHFPFKKPNLLQKGERFVNRQDWQPSSSLVLCEKHFSEGPIAKRKKNNFEMGFELNSVKLFIKKSVHYLHQTLKVAENYPNLDILIKINN